LMKSSARSPPTSRILVTSGAVSIEVHFTSSNVGCPG
jgi:hypothetical protein